MKKTIILTLCLMAVTSVQVQAQALEWAKSAGGSSIDQGWSSTVDSSGNVYTIGRFQGTADFDPGAGTTMLSSVGGWDIFIQKLDASGNFVWAKSFGSTSNDVGESIAVDAIGNIYSTGYFFGIVDFDPSADTTNLISAGGADVFVQKLDASGNFIWAKSFGGTSNDYGQSITVDASGNIYTTGYFRNTVDFNPGAGMANLTSVGSDDVFVQKLDTHGNFIWAKSFGGSLFDYGNYITLDASRNVYITGFFQGTADFDPGFGTTNLTSEGALDVFVQKLDSSGNFIWAKSFGGSSWDVGESIAVDDFGNVYTIGRFEGTVDFDPGSATTNLTSAGGFDVFVQKLDASGNFIWAKSFGSSLDDVGKCITVDALGNIYTTGFFFGTIDLDPGAGTALLTSAGIEDVFVMKSDTSGNFIWAKSLGGSSFDSGESIYVDALGNVYTTGWFQDIADFDPGVGTAILTSAGDADVFVQKMSQSLTGLVEIAKGIQIKAYPNPSKGLVQLSFEQELREVEITVSDMLGKVVFTQYLKSVSQEQIEIEGAAGVYFLSVKTPQGQTVVKLIKE